VKPPYRWFRRDDPGVERGIPRMVKRAVRDPGDDSRGGLPADACPGEPARIAIIMPGGV
jgi:hypothetical protein